jgi:ATP-binding cassette subfamily B protein
MAFPIYTQTGLMDCGPTCLRMIARHYGRSVSYEVLKKLAKITGEGASVLNLRRAAEKIGFKTLAASVTFRQLDTETPLPCIIHWNSNHFVVIPPQDYSGDDPEQKIEVADPGQGLIRVDKDTFLKCWLEEGKEQGVVIMLEPGRKFYR